MLETKTFISVTLTALPGFDDLADRFFEGDGDIPGWIVGAHFAEVGVVADVVADAVFVHVGEDLFLAGELLGGLEGFEDGAGVGLAAAEVVHLAQAWRGDEGRHELGHVERVDVVTHLFAFVAEYAVLAALQVALHEVAEEAVELDAAVVGAREAAAAQAAGGHVEIASVLLHHHVAGDLRGAEQRVLRLVDCEGLCDAVRVGRIGVVPAGFELLERDAVGGVAVNLVGAHVHEGRLGAGLAGGLQHVERADRVGVEIVERDRGGAVVRGLRGGVHDGGGLHLFEQREHAGAVTDIELVVDEARQLAHEAVLVPPGVALRTEEDGALVVIHTVDRVAEFACEIAANLGANEAGRPGDD